jgi:sulfite exporter TauE/SafE
MTDLWMAIALGAAGSLHCAAMCGPLVATVRRGALARTVDETRATAWLGRAQGIAYHGTRVAVYGAMGLIAGAIGRVVTFGGLGRGLAVASGLVLIAMATQRISGSVAGVSRVGRAIARAMATVRRVAQTRPLAAAALAGGLNGLLPCGLVYAALTAAVSTGRPLVAATFMIGFGLATTPVLAAVWIMSRAPALPSQAARRFLAPAAVALVGLLLIARGVLPEHAAMAVHHHHEALRP